MKATQATNAYVYLVNFIEIKANETNSKYNSTIVYKICFFRREITRLYYINWQLTTPK